MVSADLDARRRVTNQIHPRDTEITEKAESFGKVFQMVQTEEESIDLEALEERLAREKRNACRRRHQESPCPRSVPYLRIVRFERGAQILRFDHDDTPQNALRPYGAAALQLFVAKGSSELAFVENAHLVGEFKRNPLRVEFGPEDDRKFATYYARWVGHDGDVGPWSLGVSMRIAA